MNKYRAWDKNDKKMRQVETISFLTDFIECKLDSNDDPVKYHDVMCVPLAKSEYILMQSTRLKDKNGVEIFEGDVLVEGYGFYLVIWSEEESGFILTAEDFCLPMTSARNMKVCGNKYTNPELLKEVE